MTGDEIRDLVAEIQRHQSEFPSVEVKSASVGTPLRATRESFSAFSNRPGGGVLLLGLDEASGFSVGGVHNTQRLLEEISNIAANEVFPAIHPEISILEIEPQTFIVTVEIPEISTQFKPCYVRAAGMQGGSFIRVGLSNRRMSDYEIFGYVSSRVQPAFDSEPIRSATLNDLDQRKIDTYLATLRSQQRRIPFLERPRDEVPGLWPLWGGG